MLVYLALAQAVLACGFERETTQGGIPLRWKGAHLPYDVTFSPSSPARAALDTWEEETRARIRPEYRGPSPAAQPNDGKNTITQLIPWNPRFGDSRSTIAQTDLIYDTGTGEIMEADIYLNAESFTFAPDSPDAIDPQSAITHEAGHMIGFAHTCGIPGRTYPSCFAVPDDPPGTRARILGAVMAPTLSAGTVRRALNEDDRAGVALVYAPSSTVAVPMNLSLGRTCPSGSVALAGDALPPRALLFLRFASGELRSISAADLSSLPKADLDLIVADPSTGAYGSIIGAQPPPDCATPEPSPADAGGAGSAVRHGGCTSTGAGRQEGGVFVTLIAVALFLKGRRRAALLFSFALCSALPSEALAYKCSRTGMDFGPSLIWTVRTIPWYVLAPLTVRNVDHDSALNEIKGAFHTWESVACTDISLPFQGEMPGLRVGYDPNASDNKNVVAFIGAAWPYDKGVVAVTTNSFDTRTGVVVNTSIEVNNQEFTFNVVGPTCDKRTGIMDLRNAITHEVGHLIGLDHPPNEPQYACDTMFASAPPCEIKKRTLAQDDMDGICTIYPKGQATHQCFPPNGPSFKVVSSSDGLGGCTAVSGDAGAMAIFLAALIGLGLARRRPPSL